MNEFDITGLRVGLTVPNYRKMCELLGDKTRTGEAKRCQLKRWERMFRFERTGNAFRVLEIGEQSCEKLPRRRKGEYIQYIEPVLIDRICREGGDNLRISLTSKELFCAVGLVNSRYLNSGNVGEVYGDISGFDVDERVAEDLVTEDGTRIKYCYMYWFRTKTTRKFSGILRSSLSSMMKRKVIDVDYEYVVVTINDEGNERKRIAGADQILKIENAEKSALSEMGLSSLHSLQQSSRVREYYDCVNKILAAEYGLKRAFRRTVITLNKEHEVGGRIRKEGSLALKRKLNKIILGYLADEAQKDKGIYDSGDYPYNPNSWKSKALNESLESADFLQTQREIADYLIKIKNS